ncbi:hypothetical protein ACLMJK_001130 [Lecanora helva]
MGSSDRTLPAGLRIEIPSYPAELEDALTSPQPLLRRAPLDQERPSLSQQPISARYSIFIEDPLVELTTQGDGSRFPRFPSRNDLTPTIENTPIVGHIFSPIEQPNARSNNKYVAWRKSPMEIDLENHGQRSTAVAPSRDVPPVRVLDPDGRDFQLLKHLNPQGHDLHFLAPSSYNENTIVNFILRHKTPLGTQDTAFSTKSLSTTFSAASARRRASRVAPQDGLCKLWDPISGVETDVEIQIIDIDRFLNETRGLVVFEPFGDEVLALFRGFWEGCENM